MSGVGTLLINRATVPQLIPVKMRVGTLMVAQLISRVPTADS